MLFFCKRFLSNPLTEMIGNKVGHRLDPFISLLLRKFLRGRQNPTLFTVLGFLAALASSLLIFKDVWILAGAALILSGLFDLFDGVVARNSGQVTVFGGFLDSVLDRYSDLLFLLALLFHYLTKGETRLVILTAVVSIGTALIPYVRAKAESLQLPCTNGLMERAERIILFAVGIFFHWMEPVLWVLAVLTHFTVLQRIYSVWKTLRNEGR